MSVEQKIDITESEELPMTDKGLAGYKVIVLDDDSIDQERISRALKAVGVNGLIGRAGSLQEFSNKINVESFDFAFIDFNLKDGTGLDALQMLSRQKMSKSVLPIMVSGDVRSEVVIQAMKDGCKDYINKDDLSPEALREAMRQALKKSVPQQNDEAQLQAQVQVIMKVVNDAAISDLRPRLSKLLRLIRQTRNAEDVATHSNCLDQLDQTCLELQAYCENFSKEVGWRAGKPQ